MPGIGLRQRGGTGGQAVAREDRGTGGAVQRVGVKAKFVAPAHG